MRTRAGEPGDGFQVIDEYRVCLVVGAEDGRGMNRRDRATTPEPEVLGRWVDTRNSGPKTAWAAVAPSKPYHWLDEVEFLLPPLLVEEPTGRTDERPTFTVFVVAWLLTNDHQLRIWNPRRTRSPSYAAKDRVSTARGLAPERVELRGQRPASLTTTLQAPHRHRCRRVCVERVFDRVETFPGFNEQFRPTAVIVMLLGRFGDVATRLRALAVVDEPWRRRRAEPASYVRSIPPSTPAPRVQ